jgi:hypothetical protein
VYRRCGGAGQSGSAKGFLVCDIRCGGVKAVTGGAGQIVALFQEEAAAEEEEEAGCVR